jgi:hypothetical protein
MKQKLTKFKDKNIYQILYKKKIYKIEEYFKPRNITPYNPLHHNQVVLTKWMESELYPNGGYYWQVRAFDNVSQAKDFISNPTELK